MDRKEIPQFSIPQIKSMAGIDDGISDEFLIVHHDSSVREATLFNYPCRIDALIFGVCAEGETTVWANLCETSLRKNMLFVCGPNTIIEMQRQDQTLRTHVICISMEFMRKIHINIRTMMPLLLRAGERSVVPITDGELTSLLRFIDLLGEELKQSGNDFQQDVVCSLISACIYKVCNILSGHLPARAETGRKSRAEEYFRQFVTLLGEHYKEERSVGFYARQMYITPKYLTTLIKRISGKSVSEWIDNIVVLEAKTLLKYSNMSIQEISYYLNFPNQSFFGSYFKRNTGMSPSQYQLL